MDGLVVQQNVIRNAKEAIIRAEENGERADRSNSNHS